MPTVPAACQPHADAVAADEQQYATLAGQASSQSGAAAWATLGQLGALRARLTSERAALDACVAAHTAALSGTLLVIDTRPGAPQEAYVMGLWNADDPSAAPEHADVVDGEFGFQAPLPAAGVLTVQSAALPAAAAPAWIGLDYRSGPLGEGWTAQSPRVELLLLPAITIGAAALRRWGESVAVAPQRINDSAGVLPPIELAVLGIDVEPVQGMLQVTVHATLAAIQQSVIPIPTTPTPIGLSAGVQLDPDTQVSGDHVVRVSIATSPPVTILDGGLLGGVANTLTPLVTKFITGRFEDLLTDGLDAQLPVGVAEAFALTKLPDGCRVSARSVEVTDAGIVAQLTVGTIGTGLSTFVPAQLLPA